MVPEDGGSRQGQTPRRGLPRRPGSDAPIAPAASTPATTVSSPAPENQTSPDGAGLPERPAGRSGLPRKPLAGATADLLASQAPAAPVSPELLGDAGSASVASPPRTGTRGGLPRTQATHSTTPPATVSVVDEEPVKRVAPSVEMAASAEAEPDARRWFGLRPVVLVLSATGFVLCAAAVVLIVRWFLTLDFMVDFVSAYPGETHLPENAPVGFPAWLGWQHFLNGFFLVLIVKTGWQVRTQKRPPAMWTRSNSGVIRTKGAPRKISLTLWAHLSVDVLWLLNGVIFVVLLFVTGQWMRVVPTSWEVIPNAASAALQYISLDWPTENGWVNYNSLQLLAYFTTIFIAAPLAAITGVRMSGAWPATAKRLNELYPIEWARAIHFPVMLYFVLFVIAHVTLVLATGALRNLNHMYGGQDAVNWTGFWIFMASVAVMITAALAARPLVWAPIARLTGKVGR